VAVDANQDNQGVNQGVNQDGKKKLTLKKTKYRKHD